jgi:hypothetical protein
MYLEHIVEFFYSQSNPSLKKWSPTLMGRNIKNPMINKEVAN